MKTIATELGNFVIMHNAEYLILLLCAVLIGIYLGWIFTYYVMVKKVEALEVKSMNDKELVTKIWSKYE